MSAGRRLTGSLEDYLEAIYHLIRKNHTARVKDLAETLRVKKSSVTVALRTLAGRHLIHYSPYSEIALTPAGKQAAEDVIRRHEILKEFLSGVLGVDEIGADETACRMEHDLPAEVTERLVIFMEFIALQAGNGSRWIRQFADFYHHRTGPPKQVRSGAGGAALVAAAGDLIPAVPLSELKIGVKAAIVRIAHQGEFRKRILEMGVTLGAVLMIERVAPWGDPIDIRIRGYHLSLRKEEARNILVRPLG